MFTDENKAHEQNRKDESGNCEHEFDHFNIDGESILTCCFCRATYVDGERVS